MSTIARSQSISITRAPTLHWIASMTVSWALAGGAACGTLIAGLVLTSRLHSMGIVALVVVIAMFGSLLGTLHGAILGHLGRPYHDQELDWRGWLEVAAFAVAACVLATAFAVWLAISAMAASAGQLAGTLVLTVSVLIAAAIFAWATLIGWRALETAYDRWPEKRLGTRLVIGASAILLTFMLLLRGPIPGTEISLSPTAAVLLTLIAALWIVSPAVIVTLRFAARTHSGRELKSID